jgi:hypothetical protein
VLEGLLGLPKDEGANGKALENGVDQFARLFLVPHEFALEHRQLDLSRVDLNEQRFILFIVIIRLRQNMSHKE